ncbi:S-adenosyl-L-methionine-dependent methyltransferase [Crassisporium funariophilum]|nr:S-adenosyl-L-methionine-dependent methyltransferase [Crassisporium funariophilum]
MKLSNALSILLDIRIALSTALLPALKAVLRDPTLLLRPAQVSRIFMAHVWTAFADGVDANQRVSKEGLITPNARGVVLDVGAGHGHTVMYLDRRRVTRYVALEPNTLMHAHIRAKAHAAGFHESDGTLLILSCGAEHTSSILSSLSSPSSLSSLSPSTTHQQPPIDTIISILALCTIPSPQHTLQTMTRDLLKPGGQLLYFEHVLSPRPDVVWWQRFWAPVWVRAFDGCRIDRATDVWVREMGVDGEGGEEGCWREGEAWGRDGQEEETLFWHSIGRYVKR